MKVIHNPMLAIIETSAPRESVVRTLNTPAPTQNRWPNFGLFPTSISLAKTGSMHRFIIIASVFMCGSVPVQR